MMGLQQWQRSLAFGLRWDSDVRLHQFAAAAPDGTPADVTVTQMWGPLRAREAIVTIDNAALCTDGVRYRVGREVTFDVIAPDRVAWTADEAWTGVVPDVFFSTLTALLLAWRGNIPIHGTAVELASKAVLICGPAGAGKSTLAAGLIALGAKLISDDLSVLQPRTDDKAPALYAGRHSLRLFPVVAGFLKQAAANRETGAATSDKNNILPPRALPLTPVPLSTMIVLGRGFSGIAPGDKAKLLHGQLFRPKWMRAIPGSDARLAALARAARMLHIVAMPTADVRDAGTFISRAEAVLQAIKEHQS